jgi:hypothetical protein
MELVIECAGNVRFVYDESVDLTSLGPLSIRRASHVEPDEQGRWHADLSPVGGPRLGPFYCRSSALAAEQAWLGTNWLARPSRPLPDPSQESPCAMDPPNRWPVSTL